MAVTVKERLSGPVQPLYVNALMVPMGEPLLDAERVALPLPAVQVSVFPVVTSFSVELPDWVAVTAPAGLTV